MWRFFYTKKYIPWSLFGTAFIISVTYFMSYLDIRINMWFGLFYDHLQKVLGGQETNINEYYNLLLQFGILAGTYVFVATASDFFIRHWIFRWRKSMNDYYVEHWHLIHDVEGASQRVQEDCRLFSSLLETIGLGVIRSFFTLFLFVPLLYNLGSRMPSLTGMYDDMSIELIIFAVSYALVGTVGLAIVGIKLPGLQFANQRVEARYRKHLVYCEDRPHLIQSDTYNLFDDVRKNYFKIFLHYSYFDIAKWTYLQFGVLVPYIILGPNIFSGIMTLGLLQEIVRAFGKVENSLQVFVNAWTMIVEFMSVYKRLREFERRMEKRKTKR